MNNSACKNVEKKFGSSKKLRIFAARLGKTRFFSGGVQFIDNIERVEVCRVTYVRREPRVVDRQISTDNEVKIIFTKSV